MNTVMVGTKTIWQSKKIVDWQHLGGPYVIEDTSNIQNRLKFVSDPARTAVANIFNSVSPEDVWVIAEGESEGLQCQSIDVRDKETRVYLEPNVNIHDYGLDKYAKVSFYKAVWG